MGTDELVLIILVGAANLALGFGLALILARKFSRLINRPTKMRRYFLLIVGMYFLESLAFPAGMATQVLTVGLAFVWGIVLGVLLRQQSPVPSLQFTLQTALYTCLPTITFGILVPVAWALTGNSLLSVEAGINFGIPQWIPWPLGSVAGFAAALVLGTVILKPAITVCEVSLILHIAQHRDPDQHDATPTST
jgi:hypothetical protein